MHDPNNAGLYTYAMQLNVPGFGELPEEELPQMLFDLFMLADNTITDLVINGLSFGPVAVGFNEPVNATEGVRLLDIGAGTPAATIELMIVVENTFQTTGNPTGLDLRASISSPISEPPTSLLLSIAMLMALCQNAVRHRRSESSNSEIDA